MSAEQGGTPGAMSDRMRALLSRAAEEQLLEQRQVSAVLGELRALVEDVDERLATGEQVERVAAEVRELSARVEARLDAAEVRATELEDRIVQATALVGQAAQDLVDAVADRVAERIAAQLRALAESEESVLASTERRLASHVDDAVLALAEVVLRRGRPAAPAPVPSASGDVVEPDPVGPPAPGDLQAPPPDDAVDSPADGPEQEVTAADPSTEGPEAPATAADDGADPPSVAQVDPDLPDGPPAEPPAAGVAGAAPADQNPPAEAPLDEPPAPAPSEPAQEAADQPPSPGDGFVLVPADVREPDAGPLPPVAQERRTADRRTSGRDDGSGRRRRPWWRPS